MSEHGPSQQASLRLDLLPSLPQSRTIRELAPRLWRDERVVAIWLGGSFASGAADAYSDIDLRVAVPADDLPTWESPDLDTLLGTALLARQFLRFGKESFLHHLILANGDILDLLIQSVSAAPGIEPNVTLGCRDDAFAQRLVASDHAPETEEAPVSGDVARELIVALWVNSHKHRKVLYRHLDMMFPAATYFNWQTLMRLWYIAATGNDVRREHFTGIHGLTELVRAVAGEVGAEPLALCGMPTRNQVEVFAAIERYQDVIAALGRTLALRYGFAYPEALEAMVRREWRAFRAQMERAERT